MAVKIICFASNSLIATLLLSGALTVLAASECSNISSSTTLSWRLYQSNCYSASSAGTYDYEAGKEFCRRNGGYLTSVHSLDEMRFILNLVGDGYTRRHWIGLRKVYPHGYQWEDGTTLDYINWLTDDDYDDPIFYEDTGGSSGTRGYDLVLNDLNDQLDRCVSFRPPEGSWLKGPCEDMYHVICKYASSTSSPATVTTAPVGFCPEGWYTFGDSCYKIGGKLFSEKKGWNDASYQCKAMDSELVSVHSASEQDFLNTLMLEVSTRIWIGLSRTSSRSEFNWKDDSPLDYSNWNEGEPNNHLDTEENCVQMLERRSVLGEWNDAPCRLKFPYICKKPRDIAITQESRDPSFCAEPEGWLKIKSSCYKIYNEAQNPTSWHQAQNACAKSSAILASLTNFQVTAELRGHMTEMDGYFWIGISRTAKHRYTWIGGAPLIYSNWQSNQPQDVSDESNCVAMDTSGEWIIRNCNESLPFICEVHEEPLEPYALPPTGSNMTCPVDFPNWHDFGGKYCYIIEVQQKVKWYEAWCRCTNEGGNLASFHSSDEIDLMVHYLKDIAVPLHIGFERNRRGSFGWTDGSPIDFDNWDSGQPNSIDEQCAVMQTNTGKWKDIYCSARHGYICSVLKVPIVEKSSAQTSLSLKGEHSTVTIAVITVCTLSVLVIAAVFLFYFYPSLKQTVASKIPFGKLAS